MGRYSVELAGTSKKDLQQIYKSGNKALIRKVEQLFRELSDHPYEGTGKPEQLKYQPFSRLGDSIRRIGSIYSA